MEKRFKILRFVGSFYKVVGIIIGAITIISALGFCILSVVSGTATESIIHGLNPNGGGQGFGILGGVVGGLIVSLLIILGGGIYAVTLYALGEAVYLLIALEENTRHSAAMLHRQLEYEHPQPVIAAAPPQAITP
jgi:hypothetical protein